MKIWRILTLPMALLTLAAPAPAAEVSLAELSSYINSINTAETRFEQVNADGSRSTGQLFIQRPNRMRFEYAEDKTLVLASAQQVAIFDPKSNQPPEQYPLKKTPLNLILAANVDLGRARMVVAHGEERGYTTVTAQDPDNPEYGTIKLYFTEAPVALVSWIVTDQGGGQTLVKLGPLKTGETYSSSLFNITVETQKRARN